MRVTASGITLSASPARPRLVEQRRGLEGLGRGFPGRPGSGQPPQLLVPEWQQLVRRVGISGVHRAEQRGDLGHGAEGTWSGGLRKDVSLMCVMNRTLAQEYLRPTTVGLPQAERVVGA